MKCTQELMEEHESIKLMLSIMQGVSQWVARLQPVPERDFGDIARFLTVFVDRCHHVSEEKYVFPALERAGVGRESGIIGALLAEHEQGRQITALLIKAFEGYRSPEAGVGKRIRKSTRDYCTFLRHHIHKENYVLFPVAEGRIGKEEDARLLEAFEAHESEELGPGKHEALDPMLSRLKQAYPE
jgi:hemerythrin-like domain-containing protein